MLVGYAESGETRTIYKDGEANSIGEWEFPLSPTLIIKSNERMIASGVLNTGIRERLYRFRLDAGSFGSLSDDVKDPKLHADTTVKGEGNQLSKTALQRLAWSGGAFDIRFDFYIGSPVSNSTSISPYTILSIHAVLRTYSI